jgi:formylglycine-generating enzyme required for sulfatase activity
MAADRRRPPSPAPAGRVPGDGFLERRVHRVAVDGFWMDVHPVTNAEFRRIVTATGHIGFRCIVRPTESPPP